ncbi:polyketide cyclase [Streptomyces sp. Tu 6176]|uniref:SRPBCC family protein n=1 Tax=Streptomyces sp. Tu 6176 TaxID=1470557 RepID=UPI00044BB2AB|nr:SRPBCC family protein [Streptomyces sp. Tu 6176]EYT82398.1 polyketide cyclase [Streptomyces sp. Tu 6176]
MAVRHRLIRTAPEAVWAVLADGTRYADWVVGTARSAPVCGRWPQVGSAIEYQVRLGPLRLTNRTTVRNHEEGTLLELEADAGFLGTARIAVEVRPWGEHTLVIVDEHPLRGAGGAVHNMGVESLIQLRHRAMLARLAKVCEAGGDRPRSAAPHPAGAPGGHGDARA